MLNSRYQILTHRADLKIKSFGQSKKEVFENMLIGMQESLRPELTSQAVVRKIQVESDNLENLLVDFLNEVNYLNEINFEAYNRVKFLEFSDKKLVAQLYGFKVNFFGEDIKAVSYHDLKVEKVNSHWEAVVLFDV